MGPGPPEPAGSKLLRVPQAALCPALWKGREALVSEAIRNAWHELGAPKPALVGEVGAHSATRQESQREMQMAEMSPYTLLFCRHRKKSVFRLANTPPEL